MIYRFNQFSLDDERIELRSGSEPVDVEPQVFSLVAHLIKNRHRVVSKDELIDAVWGGRIVSDSTLSSRINAARRAVGDSGKAQAILHTVARRGFRFVADVAEQGQALGRLPIGSSPAVERPGLGAETDSSGDRKVAQTIRFCTTLDGVQLAHAIAGSGQPLVKAANWLNHLDYDWISPVWRDLFFELTRDFEIVGYDERGTGLSDWDTDDISFDAFVSDLETVVDATELKSFALLGISQGAALAIDYATRYPDRVSRLILWGGYARGRRQRGTTEETEKSQAFLTLMRQGWGQDNPVFRKMFASLYLPDCTAEQIEWWTDLQRVATSPQNAIRIRQAIDDIDVAELLPQVTVSTLILHSRSEAVAPLDEARLMAAKIPNARFVLLDSANHLVMPQEQAWLRAVSEIKERASPFASGHTRC